MAHITWPALSDKKKLARWRLRLQTFEQVWIPPRARRKRSVFILDALYSGSFFVPPQNARLEYDNDTLGQLDLQTLLDAMQGQTNTTDIPLMEPTITVQAGWTPLLTNVRVEDQFCRVMISETGVPAAQRATKKAGDVLLWGNPPRMYRLFALSGSQWILTPGILPDAPTGVDLTAQFPAPATALKVRFTNQVEQERGQSRRGGWDVDFEEA